MDATRVSRHRLRWFQFSLGSLLLVVTAVAVMLSAYKTWTRSRVIVLTSETFADCMQRTKGPVLVEFAAEWCKVCKTMEPIVEEVAWDFRGRATVARIDVDANSALTKQYGVVVVPTFLLFIDGEVVERAPGSTPKTGLLIPWKVMQ